MPEWRAPRRQQLTSPRHYTTPQTRRVRHVKSESQQDESIEGSVDAEAALYIKELHKDWANINFIPSTEFNPQTNNQMNKRTSGEIWVETLTKDEKLQWLSDTGSPRRSFINHKRAKSYRTDRKDRQC